MASDESCADTLCGIALEGEGEDFDVSWDSRPKEYHCKECLKVMKKHKEYYRLGRIVYRDRGSDDVETTYRHNGIIKYDKAG